MAKVVLFGHRAESIINFRGPILRAMVEAGHEVYAITPSYKSDSRDELLKMDSESNYRLSGEVR